MARTKPKVTRPSNGKRYDVVIVGAGISGAILAKELAAAGKSVLILEAGRNTSITAEGYQSYVDNYYLAAAKVPNSPYPFNPNAQSQDVLSLLPMPKTGAPLLSGYLVQKGPLPFGSDFLRAKGGTTLHWLGTCLRMLPNDFRLKSKYGHGADWPIAYDQLRPYYEMAEREIGVSADAQEQKIPGMGKHFFSPGYRYPMQKIPQSYLDRVVAQAIAGLKVRMDKNGSGPPARSPKEYEISVISTPQGRNSTPNPGYTPVPSTGDPLVGQRCEGNASCVPICPVQAKYNAMKTLKVAIATGRVDVITQAIVTRLNLDPISARVTGITYMTYSDENLPISTTAQATASVYVLAGNAIENAKLLLASGAARTSDQVGRNLMDHPSMLTWGLMPQNVGAFRGPGSTSNIPTFRDGDFRKESSAFICPLDNWGWNWGAFAPYSDVQGAVNGAALFGTALRSKLADEIPRQVCLQWEFDQLPASGNRVTIDPDYVDQLGNFRPVVQYNIDDYTRLAMQRARYISDQIFARAGIKDCTTYSPSDSGYLEYHGIGYSYRGAGHNVGTHRMGPTKHDSVVDWRQRTWDHDNLYLVGCGNMSTLGTSNPTLTMAALACWAAKNVLEDLQTPIQAGSRP